MRRANIDFNVYFLIIITLVLYSMFGAVLYQTLENQEVKIGDKGRSIIETLDRAELLKYDLSRTVEVPIKQSIQHLIRNGGLDEPSCGQSGSIIHWNSPNKTCLPANPYMTFYRTLHENIARELSVFDTAHQTSLSQITYEYYVDSGRIIGIPDRAEPIPIKTANDPQDYGLLGITLGQIPGGVRANIGWYYWTPTISKSWNASLDDIDRLKTLYVATLNNCEFQSRTNQTQCVNDQIRSNNINATSAPGANNYYFITMPSTSPVVPGTSYRIGIYLRPANPVLSNTTTG